MEENSDDDDINPMTILMPEPDEPRAGDNDGLATVLDGQHHHLRSIDSTLVIRQLPSQGLSFQLWPAANTLVALLDDHRRSPTLSPISPILSAAAASDHRPLNILELGSGTGLVGIAAAALLGANVTVTDLPHVIDNLKHNVEANGEVLEAQGGTVSVAPLAWGEAGDVEAIGREFDLVVASDVVYHDHLYEPLLQTLKLLMLGGDGKEEKKMVFVMAHLRRWKKESSFFKRARKVFEVETLHMDRPQNGSRVGVIVYRFGTKCLNLRNDKA